jgi:pimeloyl-ACP methyl ester carboxylesterase
MTQQMVRQSLPYADRIAATSEGRRRAAQVITTNFQHLPPELIVHMMRGVAACAGLQSPVELSRREGWRIDAERIACPVRIVWGTEDQLLAWPATAARYRTEWLPQAEFVELDGVGALPQLDVPLEAAELILGLTATR